MMTYAAKRIIATAFLLLPFLGLSQQKVVTHNEQTWLGYFNQTRFTDKSGVWLDAHLRLTDNFAERINQTILRVGYIYFLNDNVRLSAGYAYATLHFLRETSPDLPEHRPWQQIQWYDKRKHFNMMQYLRLEERFRRKVSDGMLINDYQFNYRIRYNMSFTIPLSGKAVYPGAPFVFISNELMINFGKEIVNNYFDQNRFFAGFGYQFTRNLNAHLGYLNVFLERPSGTDFINTHAVRLFVFHNLDFLSKE
jgi:hypothetical protein